MFLFLLSYGVLAIFINSNDTRAFNLQQMGIEAIVERGHIYLEGSETPELKPSGDTFTYKGHVYAAKQPGHFLLGSIPYFFVHQLGISYKTNGLIFTGGLVTLLTSTLLSALMMVMVFSISMVLTQNSSKSTFVACSFGFGTLILPYSGVTHHDIFGTFFSFLAFYLLFQNFRIRSNPSSLLSFLAALLSGFALFFSILTLAGMIVCGLYFLSQTPRRKEILLYGVFVVLGFIPVLLFNWIVFDHPFHFYANMGPYQDTYPIFSLRNVMEKLYFYMISHSNSIFFYSPIFFVSLLGFLLLPDKYCAERRVIPLGFFLLLAHLSLIETTGHSQYGPRYLIPSMPFVLIGLSGFFSAESNPLGRFVRHRQICTVSIICIASASILINAAGATIGVMYGYRALHSHAFPIYLRTILQGELPQFHFFYFGLSLVAVSLVLHYAKYLEDYQRLLSEGLGLCNSRFLAFWQLYRNRILLIAIVLLGTAAGFRLLHEFWRLLFMDPVAKGANDLQNFQNAMKGLFAGEPIYRELITSPYPPASYAMFWPFLGWLELGKARLLWSVTVVAVLAWLVILTVQQSQANSKLEQIFAALLVLSMNGTGVTIGNGQIGLHVLAALLPALLLVSKTESSVAQRLLASLLLLFALAKPTISAPFLWIVLFAPGGLRVLVITGIAYLGISAIALSQQLEPATAVLQSWFARASTVALEGGYGNVHAFLSSVYLDDWMTSASLLLLALLGLWLYFYRKIDPWIAIGITAIVARFWTYHRYYDDILILLPMICLFRIAKSYGNEKGTGTIAGLLLGVVSFLNLARLHNISPLRFELITAANVASWLIMLAFLMCLAGWRRTAASLKSAPEDHRNDLLQSV